MMFSITHSLHFIVRTNLCALKKTAAPPRGGSQAAVWSLVQNTTEMHHWQLYNKQFYSSNVANRRKDLQTSSCCTWILLQM